MANICFVTEDQVLPRAGYCEASTTIPVLDGGTEGQEGYQTPNPACEFVVLLLFFVLNHTSEAPHQEILGKLGFRVLLGTEKGERQSFLPGPHLS